MSVIVVPRPLDSLMRPLGNVTDKVQESLALLERMVSDSLSPGATEAMTWVIVTPDPFGGVDVLTRFNRWKQHLLVEVIVSALREPPLASSIQESFGVAC